MNVLDMFPTAGNDGGGAGTGPGGGAGTGPGPTSPKPPAPPTPTHDDAIFAAVEALRVDLARPRRPAPPTKPPRKPINTKPIRLQSSGRGGEGPARSAVPSRPDSFANPNTRVPLRFVEGEGGQDATLPDGTPDYPGRPPGPPPPEPPSGLPWSRRAAWRMAHRPISDGSP